MNQSLNFDLFSNAVELCKNHGGIENPLVDDIIGQILTDENRPGFSNWNVPSTSIKQSFLEKSDQLNTGENIENGWWSSYINSAGMKMKNYSLISYKRNLRILDWFYAY